jgi:hypothetical protein
MFAASEVETAPASKTYAKIRNTDNLVLGNRPS